MAERIKGKKQWRKPALIVLVRRKPEEAVLQACKTAESVGPWLIFECDFDYGGVCDAVAGS